MQTFRRECTYLIASHSFSISLIATVFWSPASGICKTEEFTALTTDEKNYISPGFGQRSGFMSDKSCKVLFRAAHDLDIVKVTITESNLEPRGNYNACRDKVTLYDGSSTVDLMLGEFCGKETPTYQSTGNTVLMTFNIHNNKSRIPKGFKLQYLSLDRGGFEAYKSSRSISIGAIIGIVIPAVILYCIIFIFVYRRCKYCHRARLNEDNGSSRPADLGATTVNLLDQPDQRVAAHKQKVSNGHHKLEKKSSKGSDLKTSANGQKKHTRVRHPAGDLKYGEQPHPPLHINTYIIHEDGCSGYSSEWEDVGYVNDCPGVEHHYIHINSSLFSQDPSGVFYAGSIDEDGVLHPPGDQCYPSYPVAPAPTMVSSIHSQNHLSQLQEEDRRSRGSLHSRRSPFTCGRDSPSSGRGSPFRNRVNSSTLVHGGSPRYPDFVELEGQTLTYYGMIDGHGSNSDAPPYPGLSTNTDNISNEERTLSVPPPSYEDAATGKYSPTFLKK